MNQDPATEAVEKAGTYKWLAAFVVALNMFMVTTDASMIRIALPRLTQVFETDVSVVIWVQLAFMLTSAGLLLTMGRIGDMWRRKPVFVLGVVVFTMGAALCCVAQDVMQLIFFRVIQSAGSAMMSAVANAIITSAFPARERGRALGVASMGVGAGLSCGAALGGFLIDNFGWRSMFYFMVLVGIISLGVSWVILKKEPTSSGPRSKIDIWGAVTLFGVLISLLFAINRGQTVGWGSTYILGLFGISLVLLSFFIIIERRVTGPVVDLNLFRNRRFTVQNVVLLLRFLSQGGIGLVMPFYIIQALGHSAFTAGLLATILPVLMLVMAPVMGWLSDKIGTRLLVSAGIALTCLGLFLLRGLTAESTITDIVLRYLVLGIGSGFFETPNMSSIMGSVPRERLGTGSAMIATARRIGQSSGLALAGAVFASRQLFYLAQLGPGDPPSLALVMGFQDTVLMALALCVITFLVSLFVGKPSPTSQT